ncbi:uncharacterized protein [Antennarius striatus]|uniref:uncharacterized protein isoform X2 n=1 Tax=Antennarius striatus TaxID=241820 RepID=UPI0035B26AF3
MSNFPQRSMNVAAPRDQHQQDERVGFDLVWIYTCSWIICHFKAHALSCTQLLSRLKINTFSANMPSNAFREYINKTMNTVLNFFCCGKQPIAAPGGGAEPCGDLEIQPNNHRMLHEADPRDDLKTVVKGKGILKHVQNRDRRYVNKKMNTVLNFFSHEKQPTAGGSGGDEPCGDLENHRMLREAHPQGDLTTAVQRKGILKHDQNRAACSPGKKVRFVSENIKEEFDQPDTSDEISDEVTEWTQREKVLQKEVDRLCEEIENLKHQLHFMDFYLTEAHLETWRALLWEKEKNKCFKDMHEDREAMPQGLCGSIFQWFFPG